MQPSNYLPQIFLEGLLRSLGHRSQRPASTASDSRELVPASKVAKRRAANKVARRSRAVNRQRS